MSKKKDSDSAGQTEAAETAPDDSADESAKSEGSGAKTGTDRSRRGRSKSSTARGGSSETRTGEPKAAKNDASDSPQDGQAKRGTDEDEGSKTRDSEAQGSKPDASKADQAEAAEPKAEEPKTNEAKSGAPKSEEAATEEPAGADAAGREEHREREPAAGDRTVPAANKGLDATRADELAYHDATMEELGAEHGEERGHRTVWATLFFILLAVIAVIGLTLWGAPKVAPYLPTPVARYLMPGQFDAAERVAALEQRLTKRAEQTETAIAALRDRVDGLAAEVEATAAGEETQAAIAEVRATAETAAGEVDALAARVDEVQSRLAAAREELAAMSDTLTGGGEGTAPPELAAALAALRSRLERLAETVEGGPPTATLADRIDTLATRVEELEANVAEAREARNEVSGAIRQTRLQSALDTLASRLSAGLTYDAPLAEVVSLSDVEPPEALSASAETGLATASELEASFGRHAQEAIAADIRARSGDGTVGQALGWLRSQVAGRPVEAQEGDGASAITSRIAARLEEGRLAAALAEAETLSEPARQGLGRWLEQLRARVSAERALAEWREKISARG